MTLHSNLFQNTGKIVNKRRGVLMRDEGLKNYSDTDAAAAGAAARAAAGAAAATAVCIYYVSLGGALRAPPDVHDKIRTAAAETAAAPAAAPAAVPAATPPAAPAPVMFL